MWAILGLVGGAYWGVMIGLDWLVALNAFRGAMSALMLLFPIVVVLNWLGWNSDEHLGGKLGVLAVASTVVIAAIGLALPAAIALTVPVASTVSLTHLALAGSATGAVLGALLGGYIRR